MLCAYLFSLIRIYFIPYLRGELFDDSINPHSPIPQHNNTQENWTCLCVNAVISISYTYMKSTPKLHIHNKDALNFLHCWEYIHSSQSTDFLRNIIKKYQIERCENFFFQTFSTTHPKTGETNFSSPSPQIEIVSGFPYVRYPFSPSSSSPHRQFRFRIH